MNLLRLNLFALLLCGSVTGCEWTDEKASFHVEPLEPYRQQIAQGRPQPWTTTPRLIVEHLLGPSARETGSVTYRQVRELNGIVTMIVTQEGGLDEVYAVRRVFIFVMNRGQWSLQEVKTGYKCQKSDRRYSGRSCAM